MKILSVGCVSLLAGQASASLSCTVVPPTLSKRLCEFDACPAYDTATAGQVLRAACVADCSTADDLWLKLYDGTFVRANDATLQGCRSFCEPRSVTDIMAELPRCHVAAGVSKPASCAGPSVSQLTAKPTPVDEAPPPLMAVAARCNSPLSARALRAVENANITILARNSTGGVLARAVDSVNGTTSAWNATGILPRLWYKARGLVPRAALPKNDTDTVSNTTQPKILYVRALPNATFVNGTFSNATLVARRPPAVTKAPVAIPVPFHA
ncbi:hypothetical protein B0T24DRAFT_622167 [Lasiosphaeria ovina]|uniref:Uncharacterized protein n=1 Tax=Lasiosphaeria ovina TaxID=92902 RepID=A0AAE0N8A1_9PEZI|nr:hypothetical protein B0T24DRAFT_622167 [Lasiosphaeria ovina]